MAAVVKSIEGLTAKDMAREHRRALPHGRRQVLQGSWRNVARRRASIRLQRAHPPPADRAVLDPTLSPVDGGPAEVRAPAGRDVMTTPTGAVVSDELQATAPVAPALRYAVAAIAVAMSLYHMYVAGFGPPEAVIFRGTHLLFALTLVFLLFPLRPAGQPAWRILDVAHARRSDGASCCTSSSNYEAFINRIIYIDDLTAWDSVLRRDRDRGRARRARGA